MLGTIFANRYEIRRHLGEGRNEVYEAYDQHLNLLVALKIFSPKTPTIHVYGEASILTALEGENVLRVYNADIFDDVCYIAAKIAKLGSTEQIRKLNPRGIPASIVVRWIRQALVGLGACHDRGLVHRDIKPENIFLETEHLALLGDFGLVHQVGGRGIVPADGTPVTLAPEMWRDGEGTIRSDIYSMGVSAYRLLTGAWPCDGANRDEIKAKSLAGDYVPLRDRAPHVSRRLADRISRAMALDPADRYASWRDMHVALSVDNLIPHDWSQPLPHTSHDRCWVEIPARGRGTAHEVCAIPNGRSLDIEVRPQTASRRRQPRKGRRGVEPRGLNVALRRVFDSL